MENRTNNNILIVNDSLTLNTLLQLTLEAEGFDVVFAETGLDGLKEAMSGQYNLILLDYVLPDINGLDVCRKLRKEPLTKNTTIAFISGKDESEISEAIVRAGADAYINPPFMGTVFINRINELIKC